MEFQSTHSRRVRLTVFPTNNISGSFNPRTHEECDSLLVISEGKQGRFNPRTHEECDPS